MKLGIVGLPNVGKSTLFNSMTLGKAEAANYPFCTIDPNVGIVTVPDERLTKLTEMYHSEKTTPAVMEFVDIAGLVKGASKGEGLGNKFLSHIREVDSIVEVVRCFEDANVVHVDGSINPLRDIETINLELILSDMEFDSCVTCGDTKVRYVQKPEPKLFEMFEKKYQSYHYQLPRLVFWNINSRTGTIPVKENKLGAALVSGFSPAVVKMVLSSSIDPYQCLLEQINAERYDAVEQAIKEYI